MYFLSGVRYLAPINVKICMMIPDVAMHFWWRYLYGSANGGGVKNGTFSTIYLQRIVVAMCRKHDHRHASVVLCIAPTVAGSRAY